MFGKISTSIFRIRNETTNYTTRHSGAEATLMIQPVSEHVWHSSVRVQPTHSWAAESHSQRGGEQRNYKHCQITNSNNAPSAAHVTNTTDARMTQDCVRATDLSQNTANVRSRLLDWWVSGTSILSIILEKSRKISKSLERSWKISKNLEMFWESWFFQRKNRIILKTCFKNSKSLKKLGHQYNMLEI